MKLFFVIYQEEHNIETFYYDTIKLLVVANNEDEIDSVVKKHFSWKEKDYWDKYTEIKIYKEDFEYKGEKTEPFVYMDISS